MACGIALVDDPAVHFHFSGEQVVNHGGYQRSAEQVAREHREDNAIASGVKRNLAAPLMKTTGMNTMQMHRVETKAGTAIWEAPSRIAFNQPLPLVQIAVNIFRSRRSRHRQEFPPLAPCRRGS